MDGQFSWLCSEQWRVSPLYSTKSNVPILIAYHSEWQLHVTLLQEYDNEEQQSTYTFILKNQSEQQRELRFIVHQQLLCKTEPTVHFVTPANQAILHYHHGGLSLLAAKFHREEETQLAVGKREDIFDEETGTLALSPLCQNEQECMISTKLIIESQKESHGQIWEIYGRTEESVLALHNKQLKADQLMQRTNQML